MENMFEKEFSVDELEEFLNKDFTDDEIDSIRDFVIEYYECAGFADIYERILKDLSEKEILDLGVGVFDMPVTFDGEEDATVSHAEFWEKMLMGKLARTSQPSPEDFRQAFEDAKNGGYALLLIVISNRLSATYDSACFIKEQVGYEHIYIVNSLGATVLEKVLVFEAVKLKNQGLSASEICVKLEELRPRLNLYACIDTLKYLALGGRISKTAAAIGTLANLKPIIQISQEGTIQTVAKTVGTVKANLKIIEMVSEDKLDPDYPIYGLYFYTDANALKFINKLNDKGYELSVQNLMPVGPTVSTHIGPNGYGLVYVTND
jgi:DegV family protein with EDD domain